MNGDRGADFEAGGLTTLLVDNGSLRPEPTLHLRSLADALALEVGSPVRPVSLLHSSRVDAGLLNGEPAGLLEPVLRELLAAGQREFLVLPQFFGPSEALTDYVASRLDRICTRCPDANIRMAKHLFDVGDGSGRELAGILADRVCEVLPECVEVPMPVALVDHGTPVPSVNQVREAVASELREALGKEVSSVVACSMERRPGPQYDFNEPLLEAVLGSEPFERGGIVALMFFSEGRHAGLAGDISAICEASPAKPLVMTSPVGLHSGLVKLLARRFHEALPSPTA